jgi:hypothetical protein
MIARPAPAVNRANNFVAVARRTALIAFAVGLASVPF